MGFIIGTAIGSTFMAIILGIIAYRIVRNNSIKKLVKRLGKKPEELVNEDLKIWSKHTKNRFIPSSSFSYDENKEFYADSILITNSAILIVKVKSANSGITGNANDEYWLKINGNKKTKTLNAIKQNEQILKHFIKMTSLKVPIISLVIYSNKVKFLNIKDMPGHVLVIKHAEIFDTLDNLSNALQPRFTFDEMKSIFLNIKKFSIQKQVNNSNQLLSNGGK